jgi:hypothetical protein
MSSLINFFMVHQHQRSPINLSLILLAIHHQHSSIKLSLIILVVHVFLQFMNGHTIRYPSDCYENKLYQSIIWE